MKLRNRRRLQWIHYIDQLSRLDARLPRRVPLTADPFDNTDPITVLLPGFRRMIDRHDDRKAANFRNRVRQIRRTGGWQW